MLFVCQPTARLARRTLGLAPAVRALRAAARIVAVAGMVTLGLGGLARPAAADPAAAVRLPNEYVVKAVFLYSFGRYIEWPASAFDGAAAPFVIGVIGADAFGGALDDIAAKKSLHNRPIVVQRFVTADEYRPGCHILFVSQSLAAEQQAALIAAAEARPLLLVGESPGFAARGGGANFFVDGDRVRFEINVDAARRGGLRLDAKLLSLGKPVSAASATE